MISETAVVEGAKAISGVDFSAFPDPSFRIARAVLEAGAPHMLYDAWLDGRNADPDKFVANPYPVPASQETATALEAEAPSTPIEKAIAGVLEVHRETPNHDEEGDIVPGSHCEECTDIDGGELVHEIYPCRTVREIQDALAGRSTYTDMRNKIEAMVK